MTERFIKFNSKNNLCESVNQIIIEFKEGFHREPRVQDTHTIFIYRVNNSYNKREDAEQNIKLLMNLLGKESTYEIVLDIFKANLIYCSEDWELRHAMKRGLPILYLDSLNVRNIWNLSGSTVNVYNHTKESLYTFYGNMYRSSNLKYMPFNLEVQKETLDKLSDWQKSDYINIDVRDIFIVAYSQFEDYVKVSSHRDRVFAVDGTTFPSGYLMLEGYICSRFIGENNIEKSADDLKDQFLLLGVNLKCS